MKNEGGSQEIRMVPVDRIEVLNPHRQNRKPSEGVVASLKKIGLKKPISVTPRMGKDGAMKYLLICGEGRLLAALALGWKEVPALICDVSDEEALVMSLFESSPRLRPRSLLH